MAERQARQGQREKYRSLGGWVRISMDVSSHEDNHYLSAT